MPSRTTLVKKGLRKPHRIPPYIFNQTLAPLFNRTKYQLHQWSEGIPDQRELVREFIDFSEYALVVLDACRYDYFERVYADYLDGTLRSAWSPANLTPVWLPAMWPAQYDATYVSANPNAGNFEYDMVGERYCLADHFSEVIDVWDFGWEFDIQATPPEVVTDVSLEVAARPDETRMVVHYLQPHQPYCGEYRFSHWVEDPPEPNTSISQEQREQFLEQKTELTIEEVAQYQVSWGDLRKYDIKLPDRGVESLLREDKITDEDLQRAYKSNLELVLPEVRRLVERLDCPVVVTSDHGDLLGEGGEYMHPPTDDTAHHKLREVPWFVVDSDLIGTVENDVETSHLAEYSPKQEVSEGNIEERLEHLGYK